MTSSFKSLTLDEVFTLFYIFEIGWDSKCREGGGGHSKKARRDVPGWKHQMGKGPFPSERADDTTKATAS